MKKQRKTLILNEENCDDWDRDDLSMFLGR